jgi:prolyl 4-hydroxylase
MASNRASVKRCDLPRETMVIFGAFLLSMVLLTGAQTPAGVPANNHKDDPPQYGVDVSYPVHHSTVSTNYPWLPHNIDPANNPTPSHMKDQPLQPLGNRQAEYERLMQGCRDKYGKRGGMCDNTERDRISMVMRQPPSMQNYTDVGFKKIRCPERVFKLLKDFWDKNHESRKSESW